MLPQPEYRVRPARFDELGQLAAIEHRAGLLFAATPHAHVCSAPGLAREIVQDFWRNGFVFVAVDATGTIVGFALGGERGGEGYLRELDVDPPHGRRGIGRRLVAIAKDWAAERGHETLFLSTFVDVAWNAPLYQRLGFDIVPADSLTPAMKEIQANEARAGLANRVFMRTRLRYHPFPP
jgi:GNAT superfamily N-acetyltransferase